MPTGLTYAQFSADVAALIPTLTADPNLQAFLPLAIDYAELCCYRDLDFLALHGTVSLGSAVIGVATVAVPSSVVVLESLSYGPNSIPVPQASRDFVAAVFAGSANGPPQYFAVVGSASGGGWTAGTSVLLGPAPDATYALNGYGTERPTPLSATNTTTWLSLNLPDLFFAKAMELMSGYAKNYGAQADDPRMAMSWSQEYDRIRAGAEMEEMRKKFQAPAWSAQQPPKIAVPQRQ